MNGNPRHGVCGEYGSAAPTVGNLLINSFHNLALFVIGGTIAWSALHAFCMVTDKGAASIDDILLLFIYLESGAMVGIYFKTNHMPMRLRHWRWRQWWCVTARRASRRRNRRTHPDGPFR
jgi:hypothetical protein